MTAISRASGLLAALALGSLAPGCDDYTELPMAPTSLSAGIRCTIAIKAA